MKALMVQGTSSGAGKSLLCTALCRIFSDMGYSAAPFKAMNMSLNSAVSADGGEIASAQYVQAHAARTEPLSAMNPVLLKPDVGGPHIIINGHYSGKIVAGGDFSWDMGNARKAVSSSLRSLSHFDIVVMEGSGSPAEINIRERDIANGYAARLAGAKVILVSDIDRGGAFASVMGTWTLLDETERRRLSVFLFNRMRGDASVLEKGARVIEERTGMKYGGSIPFVEGAALPDEDSLSLRTAGMGKGRIRFAAVRTPFLSNYSDFYPLIYQRDVGFSLTDDPGECERADVVILGGSKNSVADLRFLRENGFDDMLQERVREGRRVIGICGGYQMLSRRIIDRHHVESDADSVRGVGVFDSTTEMTARKVTDSVSGYILEEKEGRPVAVSGYEIHFGTTAAKGRRFIGICRRNGMAVNELDGEVTGAAVGTYVHGLFSNRRFLQKLVDEICMEKGIDSFSVAGNIEERAIKKVAAIVRRSVDMDLVMEMAGIA
ncbi:MAG: cobyric acid synthase [Thermoplasmata archaeon YP2-bin.285]|uniref:Probable cobyric acid synthase n=1 Tax=Candidatus Sysuiplasma superficiale TaxID=2823368 RepID=A0A8J7YI12_9ARCH|nr:cobyric acid synthase [Candidatus Sysuiplasma superficiale]